MPARRRFGIATASSLGAHTLLLLLIGLLTARNSASTSVLIPIELTIASRGGEKLVLGQGGSLQTPILEAERAAESPSQPKRAPSSKGQGAKPAPAPPKVLTSEAGAEPAGPTGDGRQASGAGGGEDAPAGPSRGPGIVSGPLPVYPKHALDRSLEGSVTLSVELDGKGSVQSVEVTKSSGHALLDQAAVRAVEQAWVFEPALKSGAPASGTVGVTFEFSGGTVRRG